MNSIIHSVVKEDPIPFWVVPLIPCFATGFLLRRILLFVGVDISMILFALSRIGRFISDDWWMKLYMTLLYYQISSIAVSCGTFLKQCIEGWKSQQKSFASCSKWLCIITPWVVIKNQVILYLCIQNQNNSYWNVQMQNWYKPVLLGICLLIMAPIFSPLAPNCSSCPWWWDV